MKVAVSSMGPDLSSQIDPRFGRCQYFIIVDPDTMEFEAIQNPSIGAMGGAGIQSGQLMANKGVQVLLTGNVGPNAYQTLSAAGIQIIVGVTGTVREAIERYKKGQLQTTGGPSVAAHFGVQSGPGAYPGQTPSGTSPGMMPGMGMGMGRGMGMGMGMQAMPGITPGTPPQLSPEQEIQTLKDQARMLAHQLEQINKRLEELSKKKKEE